jgi:hypothetical protein
MCSAVVAGSNSPSQFVTWSASAGSITSTGTLTAPAVSAKTSVNVTATSTRDSSKSGTFTVAVNPPVATNTPIFVGPGQLGGLTVNANDPLIAVNDVGVYSANDQTINTLHGEVTAMVGPDVLSLTQTNQVWLDGVLQTAVTTDLPPTLYQAHPVWFDATNTIQTMAGPLFTPNADQTGIDLGASGTLITWIEENTAGSVCEVWASVSLGQPQQISDDSGCASGAFPWDAGGGHLFVTWMGDHLHVGESTDGGQHWTITDIVYNPGANQFTVTQGQNIAVGIDGTVYLVWQQRGDPETVDDVTECWEAIRPAGSTTWSPTIELPPSGAYISVGNFDPVVVADGSEAVGSYKGVALGSTIIAPTGGGPLLALLPDGTRVIAWQDAAGVWFEEVPK